MLAITCDKCRRRYTATDEELRVYLAEAEGKKFTQVLCPHCGKPSKVAADRVHQALRFAPPASDVSASDAPGLNNPPASEATE
jgi:predicted amidophosphoribosyltransferase